VRPFVKRFALCCQTVVCLSCLSVCDVRAQWPNGWRDQDETWHAPRPRPLPHCVTWGPSSLSPKGHSHPPIFGLYLLRPNGCMDQDVTWYGARPRPSPHCVRWESSSPFRRGAQPPTFLPMSIVAKWSRISATAELLLMLKTVMGTKEKIITACHYQHLHIHLS